MDGRLAWFLLKVERECARLFCLWRAVETLEGCIPSKLLGCGAG